MFSFSGCAFLSFVGLIGGSGFGLVCLCCVFLGVLLLGLGFA